METDPDSTPASNQSAGPVSPAPVPPRREIGDRRNALFAVLSVFGVVTLSYVLGAAAMFFQLPTSGFLTRGFIGARAVAARRGAATEEAPGKQGLVGLVDKPGKTFDGFTLYTCSSATRPSTQVYLVNMQREIVHRWEVSFSSVWHNPPHLKGKQVKDSDACIFACHLYANGDLLVVFHDMDRYPTGYGLAKLDSNSNVIWKYAAKVHHGVEVAEDGTIYAIVETSLAETPKGLDAVPAPWGVDVLVLLSPDGRELRKPISIIEALRQSPYSPILSPLETAYKRVFPDDVPEPRVSRRVKQNDVLHTNSVRVLDRALAPKFPMFEAGQVLLSIRNLHALVVLDPESGSIVWASEGPWQGQHDAQFLDNGHLLIFDNLGSPRTSRVLEYDPRTNGFPWIYPGIDDHVYLTRVGGACQRLPNGNTLFVVSEQYLLVEVTPSKEVVWVCSTPSFVNTAKRYRAEQLSFLKAGQRPRP
jgi:hypothetical protein